MSSMASAAPRGRVLVVEDEGLIALDIRRTLEDYGFDVVGVAASGEDALVAAAANRPDLVLMDVHLQGEIDGIETAERLRAQHDVAIAYLTAYGDADTIERTKRSAPGRLLLKPFKRADLFSLVEIELHRAHAERMARRAREHEQQLAAVLSCIGDAVIATDEKLHVTFMNAAAEHLVGWTLADACGRSIAEVVELRDESTGAPLPAVLLEALWGRTPCRVDAATLVTRSGATRHVAQSVSPILRGDELRGAVLAITDVTEQRRAARDLEIAERMAALARNSRAIGHDVNNALTVVGANLAYVTDQIGQVAEFCGARGIHDDLVGDSPRALADASAGVSTIQRVVGRLRMFGSDESITESVDLADVLRWAAGTTERQWRARARLRLEIDPMPLVEADEARLGQVFLELVMRAAMAIRPGDVAGQEIGIRGGTDVDGGAIVRISTTGTPTDGGPNGSPVASRNAAKAKRSVIATCEGIVADLRGALTIEPREHGDAVVVRLPAARAIRLQPRRAPLPTLGPGRRGKILVLDDDALVAQVVTRVLGREHDVVAVASAPEAIELLRKGATFDAVVCDVVMPGVGGIEMFQWTRAQFPALASSFMFLTGGALDAQTARQLETLPVPRMDKPFRPSELRELVAALVGRSG